MKKFMALYMAERSAIEQMMKAQPEEGTRGADSGARRAARQDQA